MTIEILMDQKQVIWKMTTTTGRWSFRLTALTSRDMRRLLTMHGSNNTRLTLVAWN